MTRHTAGRCGGLALVIALASCGSGEGALAVSGCESFGEPVVLSKSFTPYESQLTHLLTTPVLDVAGGEPFRTGLGVVTSIDSLDLLATEVSGNNMAQHFGDSLGATDASHDVVLKGGIRLETVSIPEGDDPIAGLKELHGDRVQPVIVGGYPGLLSQDDPSEPSNARPHRVTWSDGEFLYILIADRPANVVVDLARSLEC